MVDGKKSNCPSELISFVEKKTSQLANTDGFPDDERNAEIIEIVQKIDFLRL